MKKLLLISCLVLISCGGGSGSDNGGSVSTPKIVNISLPPISYYVSDVANIPEYGTQKAPLQLTDCVLYPLTDWQEQLRCSSNVQGLVWPNTNFVSTVSDLSVPHWKLAVNNEPAFDNNCNTGMPNKSREINKEVFFVNQVNKDALSLRLETSSTNNCKKIPYLAISTLGTNHFVGRYGDQMYLNFDLTVNSTHGEKHLSFYHFFVNVQDTTGKNYYAWIYLGHPTNWTGERINWNWPIVGSMYYPGAIIQFKTVEEYNASSKESLQTIKQNGVYSYSINIDKLIANHFPELAVSSTSIKGFEISIEQEFLWSAGEPFDNMVTHAIVSNVNAFKINK